MPLGADEEWLSRFALDGFDDSIRGSGADSQARAGALDCLMVEGVDLDLVAKGGVEPGAGLEAYGVAEIDARFAGSVAVGFGTLARDVLDGAATEDMVEELGSIADAEDRELTSQHGLDDPPAEEIALFFHEDVVDFVVEGLVEVLLGDVVAAGDDESVEFGGKELDVLGFGDGGEEAGHAAGGPDALYICGVALTEEPAVAWGRLDVDFDSDDWSHAVVLPRLSNRSWGL